MKAYRFNAVYNDILLCEFLISDTSDFNFLAQNLCESINAAFEKDRICVFTKKKRHSWDKDSKLYLDGLNTPLNELAMRTGKKFLVTFNEKATEGIEIQYMLRSQFSKPLSSKKLKSASSLFEIETFHKHPNKRQLLKLGLVSTNVNSRKKPNSETSSNLPGAKNSKNIPKRNKKTNKKSAKFDREDVDAPEFIETTESKISVNRSFDEDFIDNSQDQEAQFDYVEETMQEFDNNNYTDEEDDDDAPEDFTADSSDDDDENLDETLDDIEDDEYSYDDDSYDDEDLYPEDDEDFMENYDNIDEEEEDFFQRDDYELYYDDEQDDDDDDKY
ncbi:MAG: hypothetical protein K8S87_05470 [Planctomycetes bacterium]|nr:hypothetical protein [Planctomycetota bacterium]